MADQPHITQTRLLTAAEFLHMPNDGKKYELVRGERVEVCRPTHDHGRIQVRLARFLDEYLDTHPIGKVTTETGYIVATNPDSVRGPDVACGDQRTEAAAGRIRRVVA